MRQQSARKASEPPQIVLRNSMGHPLQSMRVQEDSPEGAAAVRLASIAPLLEGKSFTLNRAVDSPPLPPRAQVVWVDAAGTHDARMSIREIVAASTGTEALVFDLQPPGLVRVYLERLTP